MLRSCGDRGAVSARCAALFTVAHVTEQTRMRSAGSSSLAAGPFARASLWLRLATWRTTEHSAVIASRSTGRRQSTRSPLPPMSSWYMCSRRTRPVARAFVAARCAVVRSAPQLSGSRWPLLWPLRAGGVPWALRRQFGACSCWRGAWQAAVRPVRWAPGSLPRPSSPLRLQRALSCARAGWWMLARRRFARWVALAVAMRPEVGGADACVASQPAQPFAPLGCCRACKPARAHREYELRWSCNGCCAAKRPQCHGAA